MLAIACVTVTIAGSGQLSPQDDKEPEVPAQASPRVFSEVRAPTPSFPVPDNPGPAPSMSAPPDTAMGVGASEQGAPRADAHAVTPPSSTEPVSGLVRPLTHQEIAMDGLPSSGLRCTFNGKVFRCGSCQTDSDCPEGSGCVANRETRRFECMARECETDHHCFPGYACRPVTVGDTGPIVRRCAPTGSRREGEPCDPLFVNKAGACDEGLVCHRGACNLPCQRDNPSSCPKGSTCEEGLNGAACAPDCRVGGCPQQQQCKRLDDTTYQCLESVSGECPEKSCAQGERCNMRLSRGRGVFWCAQACDPFRADSCPQGQVCGMGGSTLSTCYRQCDPTDAEACGAGSECVSVSEDMTQWGCRPLVSE